MLNIREINVDIEEIRKNAPIGANRYYQYKNGRVIYFKYFLESDNLYRMTPSWSNTTYTVDNTKPL